MNKKRYFKEVNVIYTNDPIFYLSECEQYLYVRLSRNRNNGEQAWYIYVNHNAKKIALNTKKFYEISEAEAFLIII